MSVNNTHEEELIKELVEALQELVNLNRDWYRGTAYIPVSFEKNNRAAIVKARSIIDKANGVK